VQLADGRAAGAADVLEAACAPAGDFERAVATAEAALWLAASGLGADAIKIRLDINSEKRPFVSGRP
jgi:hypothetical protein